MGKGKRVEEKPKKVKRKMSKEEIEKKKKIITRTFFSLIAVIIVIFALLILNDYIILDKNKKTNLVINNKNITTSLKNDILIEDSVIYLSKADVGNFFDKYIYNDNESNQIVTTYDKKIASIGFEENNIIINGSKKKIYAHAIKKDDVEYLPISEMADVYDVEIQNMENTKVITMDSLDREQKRAIVSSNLPVKSSTNFIAKTLDRIKKGESVIVISSDNGYTRIRTDRGKIGYIKSDKLENEYLVREEMPQDKQVAGKINLIWDYFSTVGSAPNRDGTSIDGINVVSPAFFYLDTNGEFKENIGNNGEAYINWAHNNGYKVWPMFSNSEAAGESLAITSKIMNSYKARQELIENVVEIRWNKYRL